MAAGAGGLVVGVENLGTREEARGLVRRLADIFLGKCSDLEWKVEMEIGSTGLGMDFEGITDRICCWI